MTKILIYYFQVEDRLDLVTYFENVQNLFLVHIPKI